MYRSNRCLKRNVLLLLIMWIGVTVTQAQTNEKSHMFKVGIGYSRLPLEPLEEYALDLWYAPISLLASFEPLPIVRFTFSFGFGSEKYTGGGGSINLVTRQKVLGLGGFFLLQRKYFTPYLGVRNGIVQRRVKSSESTYGRLDADNYFIQLVIGGEVAIFKRCHFDLEIAYQYASPKFFEKGERSFIDRDYPDAGFKFGSNILFHYTLPW